MDKPYLAVKTLFLLIFAACINPACRAADDPSAAPELITSSYTVAMSALARDWPPKEYDLLRSMFRRNPGVCAMICFATPGDDLYIGSVQYQKIRAPYEQVVRILDDFPMHTSIFQGLVASRIDAKENVKWTIYSEERIGLPFVPNEKNTVIFWLWETKSPRRKFYRFQLKSSTHLNAEDGLIVVEYAEPAATEYTKYNFYDADWGLAKTLGRDGIWKRNLRGLAQADMAVRLKAEHPDWADKRVLQLSAEQALTLNTAACLNSKRILGALLTPAQAPKGK